MWFYLLYILGKVTKLGILVSETFAIEDCNFYSTSTYNNANSQWASNIPTNFKATFQLKYTSSSGVGAYFQIGESSKGILCGYYGQSQIRIFDWQIGTSGVQVISSSVSSGTWHDIEVSYEDGTWTVKVDNTTGTYTKTYTTRDYVGCRCEQTGYIQNVKVKPL